MKTTLLGDCNGFNENALRGSHFYLNSWHPVGELLKKD